MSISRWMRLKNIFLEALDRPAVERAEFVRSVCEGDDELAGEVLQMLDVEGSESSILEPVQTSEELAPGVMPEQLGDFELLDVIGRGGMGTVYKARQVSLDRIVALKVLAIENATPQRLERFRREALAVARLDHPSIISILYVGEERNVHFFVMELVDGCDLASELRSLRQEQDPRPDSRTLPDSRESRYFRTVARIVRDVADALSCAHDSGIVHRDIKPHNILFGRDQRVFLVDFGLARDERFGTITKTGDLGGTPYYMSPEQVRMNRSRAVDHRTDIYSLGVVLFELLTLTRPFEGSTSHEIMQQIVHRDAPRVRRLNSRVPRDLDVICSKAMDKVPAQRYACATDLRDDLDRFLGHEAIHARPPSLGRKLGRVSWKYRYVVVLLLLLVGALLTGSVVARVQEKARRLEILQETLTPIVRHEQASLGQILDARRALTELESDFVDQISLEVERARTHLDRIKRDWIREGMEDLESSRDEKNAPGVREVCRYRGLLKLSTASFVFPDDLELSRLATAEAVYPTLSVRAVDSRGGETPARVDLAQIDVSTGIPRDSISLGSAPLRAHPVVPGTYRVIVRFSQGGFREFFVQPGPSFMDIELKAAQRIPETSVQEDMVLIPKCDFTYPDSPGSPHAGRTIALESFWIDRYEVTNAQYRRFLANNTDVDEPRFWQFGYFDEYDDLPVVGISWDDAQRYAQWVGKRLPTLAEWTRAARGIEGRLFPYLSDDPQDLRGNVFGERRLPGLDRPDIWAHCIRCLRPVTSHPEAQSPEGVFHLFGNVEEFTESLPLTNYGGALVARDWDRWIVGAAWDARARRFTVGTMQYTGLGPDDSMETLGFRCAKSAR